MAVSIVHHQPAAKQQKDSRNVQWPAQQIIQPENDLIVPDNSENVDSIVKSGSDVIKLNGAQNLEIKGKLIGGARETCLTLTNCSNIRITNCRFVNGKNRGIYLYNCRNITIENCLFSNLVTGVLADHCMGAIVVNRNQFLNMAGPVPGGQYVQFNTVNGAGSSISYNKGENILGKGKPEDCINLYQSNGTTNSPIRVVGNWIRGGGPSASGGGIMLGDNGGSYQIAKANILVNPGEYGMAIAGGDHISIFENKIFGKKQPFTNVGLYVNAIGGYKISNATVKGNRIDFYNKTGYNNNWWLADQQQKPNGWDDGGNVLGDKTLNEQLLPKRIITLK